MYYQINRETQKLELVFSKEEYQALPASDKADIKSNFLFSRYISGWVSRAKWPNTYHAEQVAKRLGAENRGKTGEALSFAEQQERKAERAERRADRMEYRSDKAASEGTRLQKPIEDMHGDIAFFTQPNINSSAGRAFTNRRNRMWAAWERGWEEFKKSEYYADLAETARRTAAEAKAPTDKGFCQRRIDEAEKAIRAQREQIEEYRAALDAFDRGEEYAIKKWYTVYKPEDRERVEGYLENSEEKLEAAMSKAIYYREAIEALGGIQYSRENVKPGYIVRLSGWKGACEVVSCGPKNVKYKSGPDGIVLTASYAEITEIIRAEEKKPEQHNFRVGDKFEVELWNSETSRFDKTPVEIVKATEKSVTVLNNRTGEKYVRKPQHRVGRIYDNGAAWSVFLDDNYGSGFFKEATA